LFERDESEVAGAQGGLEAAAVFEDVFAGVPVGKAEVQDALAVKFGDAAREGGEAVNEPGDFREHGNLEDLQGFRGVHLPLHGWRAMRPRSTVRRAAGADCFRGTHRETSIIAVIRKAEPEGKPMIARIWHGYTKPEHADAYEAMLKPELLPGISKVKGFRGSYLMRREAGAEVEFITIILWDSLEAIRAVAGPDYEKAVIPEERRKYLARYDAKAAHYEVTSVQGLAA
jgi:heme-degrading monooxygenase HmoA